MKNFLLILALSATATSLLAQTPLPPVSPSSATQIEAFPVYGLNPAPVAGASLTVVGQSGPATYCYWAVTNYQVGSIGPTALGCIQNGPNTLSSSNYVKIAPFSYPAGTTGLDILENKTPLIPPNGACNCAVATGVTSGTISQTSNTLSSYTVPSFNANAYALTLTAEPVGSDSVHMILRQGWPWPGTQIADLSEASGGGCAEGTCVVNAPTADQEISGAHSLDLTDPNSSFSVGAGQFEVSPTQFTYIDPLAGNGDASNANIQVDNGGYNVTSFNGDFEFTDPYAGSSFVTGSVTSGTFTAGETVLQATSGASAVLTAAYPTTLWLTLPITGSPDGTDIWTGQTSGATFTPTATPVNDSSTFVAVVGSTGFDFAAYNGGGFVATSTGGGFSFTDSSNGTFSVDTSTVFIQPTFGGNTYLGVGPSVTGESAQLIDHAGSLTAVQATIDDNQGVFMESASGDNSILAVDASGNQAVLQVSGGIPSLAMTPILVGSLPAAASNAGTVIYVSDSTAIATEGQTCAGGSGNTALAFSNGSVWKCF
jgi:hypothetical protein